MGIAMKGTIIYLLALLTFAWIITETTETPIQTIDHNNYTETK